MLHEITQFAEHKEQIATLINSLGRSGGVVKNFLDDPSTSAAELAYANQASLEEVVEVGRCLQSDSTIRAVTKSIFYPRRMMFKTGVDVVQDWVTDPGYVQRLLTKEPVASRVIEAHATKGVCNYGCSMCLWSDKRELTYVTKKLASEGLMSTADWEQVFKQARTLGCQIIVFSGGGEPTVDPNLFQNISAAQSVGLEVQLYTNGFMLDKLTPWEYTVLMTVDKIRVSMNACTADVYNAIVKMPSEQHALAKVSESVIQLVNLKKDTDTPTKIGIGFVILPINHNQVEDMADYSNRLGVDFLNIRRDEIGVTKPLDIHEQAKLANQLNNIRHRILGNSFGNMVVDMSDALTALANGAPYSIRAVDECYAKYFRPAISPFGLITPCDLKAEPRFANLNLTFGDVRKNTLRDFLETVHSTQIYADCKECMPSGRTGNAIYAKLIQDYLIGIPFDQQPFNLAPIGSKPLPTPVPAGAGVLAMIGQV